MKRGQVCLVDLAPAVGTALTNPHPCVVVQSDLLEHNLRPRTIVVPITSSAPRKPLPYVIRVDPPEGGLQQTSYLLCDQIVRIDKKRILKVKGASLSSALMKQVDTALRLVLEL